MVYKIVYMSIHECVKISFIYGQCMYRNDLEWYKRLHITSSDLEISFTTAVFHELEVVFARKIAELLTANVQSSDFVSPRYGVAIDFWWQLPVAKMIYESTESGILFLTHHAIPYLQYQIAFHPKGYETCTNADNMSQLKWLLTVLNYIKVTYTDDIIREMWFSDMPYITQRKSFEGLFWWNTLSIYRTTPDMLKKLHSIMPFTENKDVADEMWEYQNAIFHQALSLYQQATHDAVHRRLLTSWDIDPAYTVHRNTTRVWQWEMHPEFEASITDEQTLKEEILVAFFQASTITYTDVGVFLDILHSSSQEAILDVSHRYNEINAIKKDQSYMALINEYTDAIVQWCADMTDECISILQEYEDTSDFVGIIHLFKEKFSRLKDADTTFLYKLYNELNWTSAINRMILLPHILSWVITVYIQTHYKQQYEYVLQWFYVRLSTTFLKNDSQKYHKIQYLVKKSEKVGLNTYLS